MSVKVNGSENAIDKASPNERDVYTSVSSKKAQSESENLPVSPFRSPSKRGIIKLEFGSDRGLRFSPVRTPNGRAGSLSPRKRAAQANHSARKRAVKSTSIYSRLMNEDEDSEEEDDYLRRQDIKIAESILRDSRNEVVRDYGSDVEFEEDVSEQPKRRGRRAKKPVKVAEIDEPESEMNSDSSVEFEDNGEKVDEDEMELEEGEEEDEESELESSDEEVRFGSPKPKSTRGRRTRTRSSLASEIKEENGEIIAESPTKRRKFGGEKRKAGRPTKAELVIGSIKSIFQQDDETIFHENKVKSETKPKLPAASSKSSPAVLSRLNESDFPAPIVSGIPKTDEKDEAVDIPSTFVPFPIPKAEKNGTILDQEILEKYFGGVPLQEKLNGRFLDERAFFLEGSEGYFEQHSIRAKPSNKSLTQLAPSVEYDSFIKHIEISNQKCSAEKEALKEAHQKLYAQWCFELSQGFNLNFYGVGSKIDAINEFTQNYLIDWCDSMFEAGRALPHIMVVNGFNPTIKFKKVLQDIVTVFIPPEKRKRDSIRFPKHVSETVPFLINHIEHSRKQEATSPGAIVPCKLVLVIHNIDGEAFREEKIQNHLSYLSSLPEIWMVSSTDNINCSLLWDSFKIKNFNFVWHNLTTYQTYTTEMSFKDVLNLGRSKKFIGDKGAKFVLSSLTSNARKLYKLLLEKQLENMKTFAPTKTARNGLKGSLKFGINFKTLYDWCSQEFITSNEITFRTVLGEFVEHKMSTIAKDDAGTEIVFVPFNYDEMEKLLKEEF